MLKNTADQALAVRESLIVAASNRFFTLIPSIHPHIIRDEDELLIKVCALLINYCYSCKLKEVLLLYFMIRLNFFEWSRLFPIIPLINALNAAISSSLCGMS